MKTKDTLECLALIKKAHEESQEKDACGQECFIDIEDLVTQMGFWLKPFWDPLNKTTLASIEKTEDAFLIQYNSVLCKGVRKYFTIAHELAHYLHHYHLFASIGKLMDGSDPQDLVHLEKTNLAQTMVGEDADFQRRWEEGQGKWEREKERIEREADRFAMGILIPDWYKERVQRQAQTDALRKKLIEETRVKWRVSRLVGTYRLFKRDVQ